MTALLFLFTLFMQEPVSFQDEILPILSDRCFACHGPDEAARESSLRLDRREDALADLGGYAAILPGDHQESELYDRLITSFESDRMPPLDSNLTLTEEEIALIARWIDEGAEYTEHWAFVPPVKPQRPAIGNPEWTRGPIDEFVVAHMETVGRRPKWDAAPAEILRRLTLDLTGLPPTPEEYAAFLADPSDRAYREAVDRLMTSPRYGERMAWEWLDAARYADTDGFQADPTRTMWPWRDWLVDSLNANVPFDQLTREMLAGDLLPGATPEQVLASGFNRNHMVNGEGGRIFEETRVENVFDRVETTATTWMGLTYNCARCHDHKYDPISQQEYYQFYDFFNQTSDDGRGRSGRSIPNLRYLDPQQRVRVGLIAEEIAQHEERRRAPQAEWDAAQSEWEEKLRATLADQPQLAENSELGPWFTSEAYRGNANTLFATEFAPEQSTLDPTSALWQAEPRLKDGQALELPSQVGAHYFARRITAPSKRRMRISLGSDDAIKVWLNGELVLANDARRGVAPDQERASLALREGPNDLLIKIVNTGGRGGIYFRRVDESMAGLEPEQVRVLFLTATDRSAAQKAAMRDLFRSREIPAWREAQSKIDALANERDRLNQAAPVVLVMDQLPQERRRMTQILDRGGYDQPKGATLASATPSFLPVMEQEQPTRLDLANWLLDPKHPLTARVTVNREWQKFFGRGLVSTPDDFGRQGEAPSNPELLDYLATTFVESGWDLKALHRSIVLSSAYRQSAHADESEYRDDPNNEWLARGPRSRMPSWMLRDQALALAGLLVEQVGGPPVRPYQPDGVWEEATFDTIRYTQDSGEALYRRSLYVFWRRIVKPTFFFDTAKRQVCEVRTSLTNTPLHALVTQNDPAYVEASRQFAARAMRATRGDAPEAGAGVAAIRWSFFAATGRELEQEEQDILVSRWRQSREHYLAHPAEAKALLSVGESPQATDLMPADHAAMTVVASIVLNLDEVLSKP